MELLLFPVSQEEANDTRPYAQTSRGRQVIDMPTAKYMIKENDKGHLVISWRVWRPFWNDSRRQGFVKLQKWTTMGYFKQQRNGRIDFIKMYGTPSTLNPVSGAYWALRPLVMAGHRKMAMQVILDWISNKVDEDIPSIEYAIPHHYLALNSLKGEWWRLRNAKETTDTYASVGDDAMNVYPTVEELHLPKPWLAQDIIQACQFTLDTKAKKFTKPIKRGVIKMLEIGIEEPMADGGYAYYLNPSDQWFATQQCYKMFNDDPNKFERYLENFLRMTPHVIDRVMSAEFNDRFNRHQMEVIIQMPSTDITMLSDALRMANRLWHEYQIDVMRQVLEMYRRPHDAHRFTLQLIQREEEAVRAARLAQYEGQVAIHRQERMREIEAYRSTVMPEVHKPIEEQGLRIYCPSTVAEVYEWGNEMGQCIADYSRDHLSGMTILFAVVTDEGDMIANGSINKNSRHLEQLLGKRNSRLDVELLRIIISLLVENKWITEYRNAWGIHHRILPIELGLPIELELPF